MKNLLIYSILCTGLFSGLVACSSAPKGFGPAYGSDFGYRNTKLQQDRFRISYTSRDAYESRDFALLRAAQIADIEGYSHFKIINGGTFDNGPNALIGSRVGVGIGSGHRGRTHSNTHIDVGVHDVVRAIEGSKVTETIEIVLLNSGDKSDPNVFDAQGVLKSIRPPVIQPQQAP